LNIFKCEKYGAVVVAFNRGHACKLLGKVLDEKGIKLDKKDKVEKIDLDQAGVAMALKIPEGVNADGAVTPCRICGNDVLTSAEWDLLQESLAHHRSMREHACHCDELDR
jgi:hypothetical protein